MIHYKQIVTNVLAKHFIGKESSQFRVFALHDSIHTSFTQAIHQDTKKISSQKDDVRTAMSVITKD